MNEQFGINHQKMRDEGPVIKWALNLITNTK